MPCTRTGETYPKVHICLETRRHSGGRLSQDVAHKKDTLENLDLPEGALWGHHSGLLHRSVWVEKGAHHVEEPRSVEMETSGQSALGSEHLVLLSSSPFHPVPVHATIRVPLRQLSDQSHTVTFLIPSFFYLVPLFPIFKIFMSKGLGLYNH